MKKLRAGILGMGYIGVSHVEAVRRLGFAEVAAAADVNADLAKTKGAELGIETVYDSMEALLQDPTIDIIHNCTPNHLHAQINRQILASGKHLLSEKPLTRTAAEAYELLEYAKQFPNQVAGVNYNYRFNPMILDLRAKIRSGELGKPWTVHGSYLQDWLLYETDYNWRLEPEFVGVSRCVSDIGTHWMDLAQFTTDSRIVEVCADLGKVFEIRKKAQRQIETFSTVTDTPYEDVPVNTEDYGTVMLRFSNGARGVFHTSEIAAGHGCYIQLEVNGSKCSAAWNQESADRMWMGYRDRDNVSIIRNPGTMSPEAAAYTALAKGHPEGWNDAFRNAIGSFYAYVRDGKKPGVDPSDFATLEDAAYMMRLVEAIVQSSAERRWVTV